MTTAVNEKKQGGALAATANYLDERVGVGGILKSFGRKVFPDHWSFMLGEVALYSFVILLISGTFLTFFYQPAMTEVIYDGAYVPLKGTQMSIAYASSLDISFEIRGGMLMRQAHHWSALLFVAAAGLHMLRVFFTGAFRKPREINWLVGFMLFVLGMAAGFTGYSLPDDLLSGNGLRIIDGMIKGIPVIGTSVSSGLFGGEFPGTEIVARLYGLHILLVPALILIFIAIHLFMIVIHKHTHYSGPGRTDENVVGYPLMPVYVAKAGGFFFIVFGVVMLISATFTINPIWNYGPYDPSPVSAGTQPDWYIGWLDGALRLAPSNWDIVLFGFTYPMGVLVPLVQRGEIPAERIAASVRRLLEMKLRTGAIQRPITPLDSLRDVVGQRAHRERAQVIAEDAITLLRDTNRELPLATAQPTLVLTYVPELDNQAGRVFTAEIRGALLASRSARITSATPRQRLDSLLRSGTERVVIATFVRTIEGEGKFAVAEHVARWIDSLAATRPVSVIAFSSPYVLREFPRVSGYVAAYGRGDAVERAAARALTGRVPFRGVTPTTLPGFFAAGQAYSRPVPRWTAAVTDSVRAVMLRALRDSVFPGGIAVIGTRTDVLAEVAVGRTDWATDAPAPNAQTVWDMASLTKVVGMTTAMMQLVEKRKVELDAPVQRYLPEWTGQWKERVTVRHLMTHSSGLRAWRPFFQETETAEAARKLLLETPLDTLPGVRYVYSDLGAILAGLIIERVSGESLDAYLAANVFGPLRMVDTRYRPPAEWLPRIAPTEVDPWRGRHLRGEVHDENAFRFGQVSAHAGLFSTAADVARFAQMMLNGGELGGARIVTPRSIAEFSRVQNPAVSHRTMGWESPNGTNSAGTVMKSPAFGHTGFTGTSLWIDPANDLFIVILTNRVNPTRDNSRIGPVRTTIADITARAAAAAQQASTGSP